MEDEVKIRMGRGGGRGWWIGFVGGLGGVELVREVWMGGWDVGEGGPWKGTRDWGGRGEQAAAVDDCFYLKFEGWGMKGVLARYTESVVLAYA